MSTDSQRTLRVAAVTGDLDWTHRTRTSGDQFDLTRAEDYCRDYLDLMMTNVETAADKGARIVVIHEYFTGTELCVGTNDERIELVSRITPVTFEKLTALASSKNIHIAGSMELVHDNIGVESGVLCNPGAASPTVQIKNTALPPGHEKATGYSLFPLDEISAGLLVCSDLTSFPEDPISLAKQGMELLLTPGLGFAGDHWMAFLTVRSIDLGVPVIFADDGRAAILDYKGNVLAQTLERQAIILADLEIPYRDPIERLYSYVGRRFQDESA
jgi:predicted amidohydrolase